MYRYKKPNRTTLEINTSAEGETIEDKVDGIVNNGESLEEGADLIYTERKEGVLPEHNIRTDRFELAVEATDYADKTHKAKREERHKPKEEKPQVEAKGGEIGGTTEGGKE